MIDRACLLNVIDRYQQTQPDGVKCVDEQIRLFSQDCVFISFPVVSVVGSAEPRLLRGQAAIHEAFVAYNQFIASQDSVAIRYQDAYADPLPDGLGGVCGFTLLIDVVNEGKAALAINHAQFHVDQNGLIVRMMNWQATGTVEILQAM